jgi:hypothetical protein
MKKTYIQPEMLVVSLATEGMIAASLQLSDKTVNTAADGAQLSNKKDPIWGGGSEDESSESYW